MLIFGLGGGHYGQPDGSLPPGVQAVSEEMPAHVQRHRAADLCPSMVSTTLTSAPLAGCGKRRCGVAEPVRGDAEVLQPSRLHRRVEGTCGFGRTRASRSPGRASGQRVPSGATQRTCRRCLARRQSGRPSGPAPRSATSRPAGRRRRAGYAHARCGSTSIRAIRTARPAPARSAPGPA